MERTDGQGWIMMLVIMIRTATILDCRKKVIRRLGRVLVGCRRKVGVCRVPVGQ